MIFLKKGDIMKDFYILFIEELNKLYNGERHVSKVLPALIHSASSIKLKKALRLHLHDTLKQIGRLEEIGAEFDEKLKISENRAVKNMATESKSSIHNCHDIETRDAAIIMHLQKLSHYELASYGNLKTFAKHFKLSHIEEILDESSKEEGYFDKKLTEIAEGTFFDSGVNARARRRCA